jgi:hypothetical protein
MGIALIIVGIVLIVGAGIGGVLNMANSSDFDRAFRRHAVVMVVAMIGTGVLAIGLLLTGIKLL